MRRLIDIIEFLLLWLCLNGQGCGRRAVVNKPLVNPFV
jgi:hypothetical protein